MEAETRVRRETAGAAASSRAPQKVGPMEGAVVLLPRGGERRSVGGVVATAAAGDDVMMMTR